MVLCSYEHPVVFISISALLFDPFICRTPSGILQISLLLVNCSDNVFNSRYYKSVDTSLFCLKGQVCVYESV